MIEISLGFLLIVLFCILFLLVFIYWGWVFCLFFFCIGCIYLYSCILIICKRFFVLSWIHLDTISSGCSFCWTHLSKNSFQFAQSLCGRLKTKTKGAKIKREKCLQINIKVFFYLECMSGYSGPYCTTRCPYPTYGSRCQGYCDCSNDTCDVSIGCKIPTTGVNFSFFTFLSICLTWTCWNKR